MVKVATKYKIKEVKWQRKTFLGKRDTVAFNHLSRFFEENYEALYNRVSELGIESGEPPCAIYYTVDEENHMTELAAVVPVKGLDKEVPEFEQIIIPESRALKVLYKGAYDEMTSAYEELDSYVKKHNLKRKMIIEEYLTDPDEVSEERLMRTNIYYLIE